MKTKSINTIPFQFGSVVEYKGEQYIFSHYFSNFSMIIKMDATDIDLVNTSQLKWICQLPVKFYKGFDYVITDAGLIIRQYDHKAVNFCEATKSKILKRARDSPYFYLRVKYQRNLMSIDEYHRIASECLTQHYINHKNDILIKY